MNARIQDVDVEVQERLDAATGRLFYAAIVDGHPVADSWSGTELLYPTPEAATLAGLNGGAR